MSSLRMELNASPEGSIITLENTLSKPLCCSAVASEITLLMLWIVKR